jgi:uncharacterized membrane protein
MAEEKMRFPWWLVVCAAVAMILAAALGFVETAGGKGTRRRMSARSSGAIFGLPGSDRDFQRQ